MSSVAMAIFSRIMSLLKMIQLFESACKETVTDPGAWNRLVADFDEDDLELEREHFPRSAWPAEEHGVPYPNLVALAIWTLQAERNNQSSSDAERFIPLWRR